MDLRNVKIMYNIVMGVCVSNVVKEEVYEGPLYYGIKGLRMLSEERKRLEKKTE